jgi:hypothetical protein
MRHSSSVTCRLSLVIILFAYLTLAVAYSLISPLYEPSDELRHVRYVRHISAYRSLPVQGTGGPRAQSHHPPPFYYDPKTGERWQLIDTDGPTGIDRVLLSTVR